MSNWGLSIGGGKFATVGEDGSNSKLTQLATSGTANTKGSWAELVASTPFDASSIIIHFSDFHNNNEFLVDVGIGASSSEKVIVPNVYRAVPSNVHDRGSLLIPIPIPSGTRISARAQRAIVGSLSQYCGVSLIGASFSSMQPFARVLDYGSDTTNTAGTQIDPGGTSNTKGAWTEIVASNTNPMRGLFFALGVPNISAAFGNFLIDISVGASSSEKIIIEDYPFHTNSSGAMQSAERISVFIPVDIPSGTRLSVRAQSSITDATDRLFDIVIYGVD